jgi:HD superfamily phosphohydrolase
MHAFETESLSHDPIHGYIPFTAKGPPGSNETTERQILDHPWVQRLRSIFQLQTAWYVFPAAEHRRFQHVLGAMHLGSRVVQQWYPSLRAVCPDVPSRGYVESLVRMAALLHDVGHGPFGHFFDDHFLADYDLTHETLGCEIIRRHLAPLLRGIRRNPNSRLEEGEQLDPDHIALLITRPRSPASSGDSPPPRWLQLLRSLFSGLYTVDNMDFVLRDAYMSGYSTRAFDLERLLRYSFFSPQGLTIHDRGLPALVRFISVRAELFRSIYFHRTVRAIDLTLRDLFTESKGRLFPGDPREHLERYLDFTDMSLLVDVGRWAASDDAELRTLGQRWQAFLRRQIPWKMACERTIFFRPGSAERSSILAEADLVERQLRKELPQHLRDVPLRVDIARHVHRPGTRGPVAGLNFLYDSARDEIRPLDDNELFRQLPTSYRICRIYTTSDEHHTQLATALDTLLRAEGEDVATNM